MNHLDGQVDKFGSDVCSRRGGAKKGTKVLTMYLGGHMPYPLKCVQQHLVQHCREPAGAGGVQPSAPPPRQPHGELCAGLGRASELHLGGNWQPAKELLFTTLRQQGFFTKSKAKLMQMFYELIPIIFCLGADQIIFNYCKLFCQNANYFANNAISL